MYLKIGEHLDIQINSYKILQLGFAQNILILRIFSLLSREAVFLAVIMKNIAGPFSETHIKCQSIHGFCNPVYNFMNQ